MISPESCFIRVPEQHMFSSRNAAQVAINSEPGLKLITTSVFVQYIVCFTSADLGSREYLMVGEFRSNGVEYELYDGREIVSAVSYIDPDGQRYNNCVEAQTMGGDVYAVPVPPQEDGDAIVPQEVEGTLDSFIAVAFAQFQKGVVVPDDVDRSVPGICEDLFAQDWYLMADGAETGDRHQRLRVRDLYAADLRAARMVPLCILYRESIEDLYNEYKQMFAHVGRCSASGFVDFVKAHRSEHRMPEENLVEEYYEQKSRI